MVMLDKIYCPEEQRQRADKALRLNGITSDNSFKLPKSKPTLRIKRLVNPRPKIKGASSLTQGHGKGPGHYGISGTQSFKEHIATCEICRQVAQMETRESK